MKIFVFSLIILFLSQHLAVQALEYKDYQDLIKTFKDLRDEAITKDDFVRSIKTKASIATDPVQLNFFANLITIVADGKNDFLNSAELNKILMRTEKKLHPEIASNPGLKEKLPKFLENLVLGNKKIKNVVLMGRTGGGKSTFLANLIDPLDKELKKSLAGDSLFSTTVDPQFYFQVFNGDDDITVARIIDTPGFGEMKSESSIIKARSDEDLIKLITDSLKGINIDKIAYIFPLFPNERVRLSDIEALKTVARDFGSAENFKGKIDLIFPRVDEFGTTLTKEAIPLFLAFLNDKTLHNDTTYVTGTIFNKNICTLDESNFLAKAKIILINRARFLSNIFSKDILEGIQANIPGNQPSIILQPATADKLKRIYEDLRREAGCD